MSNHSLVVQSQYGFEKIGIKLLTYSQAGFMLLRSVSYDNVVLEMV